MSSEENLRQVQPDDLLGLVQEATITVAERQSLRALLEFLQTQKMKLTIVPVAKGKKFTTEGAEFDDVYILVRGKVIIHNAEQHFPKSAPAILGELAAKTRKRTADVIAGKDAEIIIVPGDVYASFLNDKQHEVEIRVDSLSAISAGKLSSIDQHANVRPLKDGDMQQLRSIAGQTDTNGIGGQEVIAGIVRHLDDHPRFYSSIGIREFGIDEPLIQEKGSDYGGDVYVILNGNADICKENDDGSQVYLGSVNPKEPLVGEMALLDPTRKRSATVTATTPTTALVIPGHIMSEFFRESTIRDPLHALSKKRLEKRGAMLVQYDRTFGVSSRELPVLDEVQLATLKKKLQEYDATSIDAYLRKFNPIITMSEYVATVLARFPEGIVMVNAAGKLEFVKITAENARRRLGFFKELYGERGYSLYLECIRRSGGTINTMEGMTSMVAPPIVEGNNHHEYEQTHEKMGAKNASTPYWQFLTTPDHLLSARKKLHEHIEREAGIRADALSQRIDRSAEKLGFLRPVLIVMKGNTAAGKTTTLRTDPFLSQLGILDEHGKSTGVLNPDDFKIPLRVEAQLHGEHTITHSQVLHEGAILHEHVRQKLMQHDQVKNAVIDKRFSTKSEFERDALDLAKLHGYKTLIVVDVDAECETSRDRVYGNAEKKIIGRAPDGDDPVVPIAAILQGFQETRRERQCIIELLEQENRSSTTGLQCHYMLLKTDPEFSIEKNPRLVAQMDPKQGLRISSDCIELYQTCTKPVTA